MNTTLNIVAQFANADTAAEFTSIVGRVQGVNYQRYMLNENWSIDSIGNDSQPDVYIVEIDPARSDEVESVEELTIRYHGKIAFYVIFKEGSLDVMRRLMRSGVKDVFQRPLQPQDVVQDMTVAVTEKRLRVKAAQGGKGGVTAFINAKGGSGATTLAVNTAHVLASHHEASVALIDMDIQFGACALMLDLKPRSTIMDAILQPERIDVVFLQAIMTKHSSGVDVLCSPADVSPMERVSPEAISRIITAAVEGYDFVVLDLPRIITPWTLTALKLAEPVMLVSQNTLTTIRDARLLLDKLVHEGMTTENIELVNNRAMAKSGSVTIDKLKETLKKDRIHRIRNDYKTVIASQDQGRPACDVSEKSLFSKDVQALAAYLAISHYGHEHRKKKGFLGGLFSG